MPAANELGECRIVPERTRTARDNVVACKRMRFMDSPYSTMGSYTTTELIRLLFRM